VYPAISEDAKIVVDPKDLRVETYRSSGAGGQHVNTTDSAVRITHIPSGISVQSQNQRSQTQNRSEAMKILHSRLYALALENKNKEKIELESGKADISWGNQIRNYVFNPYKLVKDLRSGYQSGNVDAVMDGELQPIIQSVVMRSLENKDSGK
jgi:peptide chain release factor 2